MTCLKWKLGRGYQSRVQLHPCAAFTPCSGPFSCQCMMPRSNRSGRSRAKGGPKRLQAAMMRHLPDTTSANIGSAVLGSRVVRSRFWKFSPPRHSHIPPGCFLDANLFLCNQQYAIPSSVSSTYHLPRKPSSAAAVRSSPPPAAPATAPS